MAMTKRGQKYNRIPRYVRKVKGKKQSVRSHDRSNPCPLCGRPRRGK